MSATADMLASITTPDKVESRRSEHWNSTTARHRRRRPRCCTTISTSSTGSRRSWARCRAHRSLPFVAGTPL